jgi:hypothetical protein
LRHAEAVDGIHHCRADQLLPFGRCHHQFLVPVRDRACFKQDSRHLRFLQHEQRVVAVDASIGV